jgi:propanediol dehydratase large subunit
MAEIQENSIQTVQVEEKKPVRKMGRPTKYKSNIIEDVEKLARIFCANDEAIAAYLKISRMTFVRWKHRHPEVEEAKIRGKEQARMALVNKLYQIGLNEGNIDAIKFILKTQFGKDWREIDSIIKNYNLNQVNNVNDNNGHGSSDDIRERRRIALERFTRIAGGNGESLQR